LFNAKLVMIDRAMVVSKVRVLVYEFRIT